MANLNRFDLNLLVSLDMLLTERSVTRAADRLCVTQPALSGSLQRLRYHFDDPLLVRVGREMELTPKARALIEPVRSALLQIGGVLETQATFDPTTNARTFRIAMSDYCVLVFLPFVTRILAAEAPKIRVVVENVFGPSFLRLEGGETDFIITHGDRKNFGRLWSDTGLVSQPLFADSFTSAVADNHPVGDTLNIDDYTKYPHALADFGSELKTVEETEMTRHGINITDILLIPSFAGLLFQLSGTEYIVTVQRMLAELFAKMLPIRLLDPPVEIRPVVETLIWHSRNDIDPAHVWFRTILLRASHDLSNARVALSE
tara:strand:+ start:4593 stop:5543 length:951 start_codon:yes stop_codon:yes gene_type:complete